MNDDSQMSDSEYEDYAQDSLGNHSRNNLIRRVASLEVIDNEGDDDIPHHSCSTTADQRSVRYGKKTLTSSFNAKSVYGRAA